MIIEDTYFTDDELAVLDTQCNLTSEDITCMQQSDRSRLKLAILLHIGCIADKSTNGRHNLQGVVQEIRESA